MSCRGITRRSFLADTGMGFTGLALGAMMFRDGAARGETVPVVDGKLHHTPKAKSVIWLFMCGGVSHVESFDIKPELTKYAGKSISDTPHKDVLNPDKLNVVSANPSHGNRKTLMALNTPFKKYGACGLEVGEWWKHTGECADDIALIRSMHTDQFNHHPGQLLMQCGTSMFDRPAMGAWLNYGLGSESKNLPGYVVLTAGRGTSGGASLWSSGFLPSDYAGVLFRNQGDPVLNLSNPPGISEKMQHYGLGAITDLNALRHRQVRDPEIASRIGAYELAFRMQTAAPELTDLKGESKATLDAYGIDREEPAVKANRGGGAGQFKTFATNCLLARRLVERGVRFVNIFHASWDHHSNLEQELGHNSLMADQPIAALLKDLKQRGLLDETLVVWGSEFGRTPLGENRVGYQAVTGRDHHPFAFSLWMAGGGIKGGQVIGETDDIGWNVVKDPVHVNDLHATILHLFGIEHTKLTYRFQGRDFRLTDVAGKVVEKLLA